MPQVPEWGRIQRVVGDQLLPNISVASIIVVDDASYYSVRLNKLPTSAYRKAAIIVWLAKNEIHFDIRFQR